MNRREYLSLLATLALPALLRPPLEADDLVVFANGYEPQPGRPVIEGPTMTLCAACGQYDEGFVFCLECERGLFDHGTYMKVWDENSAVITNIDQQSRTITIDAAPTEGPPDLPRFGGPRA